MPTRPVFIYTEMDDADVLRRKGVHVSGWATVWWKKRKDEARTSAGSYAEYRRLLGKATQEREDLRRSGELIDSMSALVGFHLRRELEARGWNRSWPKLPPGVGSIGGRRMGSPNLRWPAKVLVTIDADLVDQLRRATHKVSEQAIKHLAAGGKVPEGVHPVVTTGDVMRAAVRRAIADWYPGPVRGTWDHLPQV